MAESFHSSDVPQGSPCFEVGTIAALSVLHKKIPVYAVSLRMHLEDESTIQEEHELLRGIVTQQWNSFVACSLTLSL